MTPGNKLWADYEPADFEGSSFNPTADLLHGAVYAARPDARARIHCEHYVLLLSAAPRLAAPPQKYARAREQTRTRIPLPRRRQRAIVLANGARN